MPPSSQFFLPSRREWLLAACLIVATTALLLRVQLQAFTAVPDMGDPLFSMWRLSWIAHALPRHPFTIFDANIFYPQTRTLALSDPTLLEGVAAAPFLSLGVPVAVVYTSLLLLSFVLCGLAMFSLAYALIGEFWSSIVAALVFAFDPFRLAHYSHLELLFSGFMPLAFLFLFRTLHTSSRRDALLTGLFLALQGLASLYYGAYLAVALLLSALAWIVLVGVPSRRAMTWLAISSSGAAVVGFLVMSPYWHNRSAVGERRPDAVLTYSATTRDYLAANDTNPRYAKLFGSGPNGERQLTPGTAPVVLAIAGVIARPTSIVALTAVGLATSIDGSRGLHGLLYPLLYRWVPPFRAFRAPARFRAVAAVFLALLAGFGTANIIRRFPSARWRRVALVVLVGATIYDLSPHLELTPLPEQHPAVYAWLAQQPPGIVCEFPLGDLRGRVGPQDPTYEYYSTGHWMSLVNGYSGFTPGSYELLKRELASFPTETSLDYLRRVGVTYLLVHSVFYVEGDYQRDVDALLQSSKVSRIASFRWRDGGTSTAFRLVK